MRKTSKILAGGRIIRRVKTSTYGCTNSYACSAICAFSVQGAYLGRTTSGTWTISNHEQDIALEAALEEPDSPDLLDDLLLISVMPTLGATPESPATGASRGFWRSLWAGALGAPKPWAGEGMHTWSRSASCHIKAI